MSITKRLRDDESLRREGWDSYGSAPLTDAALDAADLIHARWCAVPCSDGGVQLEVHTHGFNIELAISPDGTVEEVYVKQSSSPRKDTEP